MLPRVKDSAVLSSKNLSSVASIVHVHVHGWSTLNLVILQ